MTEMLNTARKAWGNPIMTGDEVRAQFKDGDIIIVFWDDPRTLSYAPWDFWCAELTESTGMSVGFIFDNPDFNEIVVHPHSADIPFADEEDQELGEVAIPYSSVREIRVLLDTSRVFEADRQRQAVQKSQWN